MIGRNVWLACLAGIWFVGSPVLSGATPAAAAGAVETVVPNDNTLAAGLADGGTLTLRLRAATAPGARRARGPALTIEALGEASSALMVPAPLIRVPEGTPIVVSIRNDLAAPLRVHGLCARDGTPCAPLDVPARGPRGALRAAGRAGTYHYWATTMGAPVPFRELAGAFVVDPPGVTVEPDRVFVITEWNDLTPEQLREIMRGRRCGRGASWRPSRRVTIHDQRTVVAGHRAAHLPPRRARVRWRVINLSSQIHPMHLHGFYFEVNSLGDGDARLAGRDGARAASSRSWCRRAAR